MIALKDDGSIDSLNRNTGYLDTSFYSDRHEGLFAALIDTITESDEVIYVAGKAKKSRNVDFEIVKLTKPLTEDAPSPDYHIADYKIHVVPNPVHDYVQIIYTMPRPGKAEISIIGFKGNKLQSQVQYCVAGEQHAAMQLPPLSSGIYLITVTSLQGAIGIKYWCSK